MASYTIEDIEMIRRKSGIGYQEAVALLDYHNGNVARALVDLERNGRIRPEYSTGANSDNNRRQNRSIRLRDLRVRVNDGSRRVLELPLIACGIIGLVAPHVLVIGVIAAVVLGYKITMENREEDTRFNRSEIEATVRNAAQNVRDTAGQIVRSVRNTVNDVKAENARKHAEAAAHAAPAEPAASAEEGRSYYTGNPTAPVYQQPYTGSAPTLQVPVKVETNDGSVTFDQEDDGYNSATIG